MKKVIKEMIALLLLGIDKVFPSREKGVLSIYFHKPSKKLFRTIIRSVLDEGYTIISLKELEHLIRSKGDTTKKAIVTFDDGSLETLDLIRSIEEFNIPVAMFIPTDPVLTGNFWWNFVDVKGQEKISGIRHREDFKKLPEEVFDQKINLLRRSLTVNRSCITLDELRRLNNLDLITIGAHTVTHPILENCSYERQERELRESRETLAKWLRGPVDYFAFPNGDYNANTLILLKKTGYKLSFTTKPGRINIESVDPYLIPRYSINDEGGIYENLAKSKGVWQRFIPS